MADSNPHAPEASRHHVKKILARPDLKRLLTSRIAGQLGDGILQAGLAGTILFNPDRHTSAMAIAIGFAILLIPYSLVGPLAGVLLDRWSRRQVLVVANLIRAGGTPILAAGIWFGADSNAVLLPLALFIIGIQRLLQAAYSAAIPHVVDDDELITANSVMTTIGGVAYAIGIGAALGLRGIFGSSDHGYGLVTAFAVLGYLSTAAIAAHFDKRDLGPDPSPEHDIATPLKNPIRSVGRELVTGARYLTTLPSAGYTLLTVALARACYGVAFLSILLLYRNYLHPEGIFRAGEAGLGQVMLAVGAGNLIAAAITPAACRRFTPRVWLAALLVCGALTETLLVASYIPAALLVASFLRALVAQGGKLICDTALQHESADDYRGRAFSVYDTAISMCMVGGVLFAAVTLPESGASHLVIGVTGACYAAIAFGYLLLTRNATGISVASGTEFDSLTRSEPLPQRR